MKTAIEMINRISSDSKENEKELTDAFLALRKLEDISGRKEKEQVLVENKNNEIFKQIFWWAQNPYLRYNIKKVKGINTAASDFFEDSFKILVKMLNDLNNKKYTGDKANDLVAGFLNMCSTEEQKWYGRILRHNLRVGITSKTFNSIIPGYIPMFKVMLAKEDKKVKAKPKNVILERKYDGYRVLTRVQDHKAKMYSRQGKPYIGFNQIISEMNLFPDGCYDGEVISLDNQFSGMQKEALRKGTEKFGILNIFDYLTLDEFDNQKCDLITLYRKSRLTEKYLSAMELNKSSSFDHVNVVSNTKILNYGDPEIEQYYNEFLYEGFEGAMMKDIDGLYTFNRSSAWLKIVPFISIDAPIIGFSRGNPHTKYENTLGALKIDYFGNEVLVAGIPEDLRDEIWNNQDYYLGKMIEVHARQESQNQNGRRSLRFPRFHQFRFDKDMN